MMKTVLCYGDSNTWGYDAATSTRLDIHTRWAGVLRDQLGEGWWVIEEGLSGRTTVHDDAIEPGRNGMTYLSPCLLTHKPLDLVILMLGTNDLKRRFDLPAGDIGLGARLLCETILKSDAGIGGKPPALLLMCPPPTAPLAKTRFSEMFAGAEEKSQRLAGHYRLHAQEMGIHFINAGAVIKSSTVDAIHFEADAHRALGAHVAAYVREHFGS
jgi:lysophospholipase L1-like esterase